MSAENMVSKNARNARVQARYDELMQAGEHGHYETMFRVVREEVEAACGQPLTDEQITTLAFDRQWDVTNGELLADLHDFARAVEAATPPSTEPLYWQWRRKGDPWTLEKTFASQVYATTGDSEVRPLFATPPKGE